jgi:hypothetical protein
MHRISGRPGIQADNPAFFISGIRPDTAFDLPDISIHKIPKMSS